jgi:hypothetical protein
VRLSDRVAAKVEFRPKDFWIGGRMVQHGFLVDLWLAIIPMVHIHIVFLRKWRGDPSQQAAGGRVYQPSTH